MKTHSLPILLLTSLALIITSTHATAQNRGDRLIFNQQQTNGSGFPGSAVGRGSRNPGDNLCGRTETPLIALVPHFKSTDQSSSNSEQVLGLTSTSSPTFWFYVPYPSQGKLTAEFDLRERDGSTIRRVSRQMVQLPSNPGLFSIRLDNQPLNVGKQYQWVFSVQCLLGEPSANDTVIGWVERVDQSTVQKHLQQAKTLKQKVQAYAQAGLWHETITTVAGELCQSDRKLAQQWFTDLIRTVNLGNITKQPQVSLLQSCPKL